MTLLLTAGGAVLALAVLAAGSLWRLLARRDHRCAVGTLPRGCNDCTSRRPGGHVLCACGAVSPHLHGTVLLAWRAQHQGERFPGTPAEGAPLHENGAGSEAGSEAGSAAALEAIEAEDEGIRRAVVRARRAPDPRTPQVLREAADRQDAPDVNKS
jgi:hypothetical protein